MNVNLELFCLLYKRKAGIYSVMITCLFSSFFWGCTSTGKPKEQRFESLPSDRTGIMFSNDVTYDENFNVITFPFLYNGGGVATGDINNDGLPDIFFTGNQVSSRLYLNKGDLNFEDITDSAGLSTNGWAGGVSMADVNGDGYLDIYISVSGPENLAPEQRKNLLFINNGDLTFTEQAEEYGIAYTGFTVHAAFFDFDLDGDLDLFLINNFPGSFARDMQTGLREEVNDGSSESTDVLYRNNGDGTFTDISHQAGILKEGYSLGLVIADINRDGWPDIYISNDVQPDDVLYLNRGDGAFTDKAADFFKHTSYAGMGADVADFNNDGWPDILQVDMMPPELKDQQLVSGSRDYEDFAELEEKGYQLQNNTNTLQLSNGFDGGGNIVFSEIAHMAGVEATEWSWTGLFGDYDNDGLKDILITNGYPKALNNYDYIMDLNRASMFGTDSSRTRAAFDILDDLHELRVPNYFFKNRGNLTFEDVSEKWGFTTAAFSYGAAHSDLDNDGDLDIVINNLNRPADILENRSDSLSENHYLAVRLKGDSLNTGGIGAMLTLTAGDQKQYKSFWPYRGYQSTMDHKIHFGLGDNSVIDSLKVIWPDGKYQLLENLPANQTVFINYAEANTRSADRENEGQTDDSRYFTSANHELKIDFAHRENDYIDFEREATLPYMMSRTGPPIAVADVNNDMREDVYLGGASGAPGVLYLQEEDGSFEQAADRQPWLVDQAYEDTDAEFMDVNSDGLPDLYVVSGGIEFSPASDLLQDRVYINAGEGKFIKDENRLPRMYTSGSVVAPGDFDGDGDTDLFVGGRQIPGRYPSPPDSYLLRNDDGIFRDVTGEMAPELRGKGMITDAVWADTDGDGDEDLVLTGEWMPLLFFENTEEGLIQIPGVKEPGAYKGWWYSIEKGDFNGDGKIDFVAGNLGLNHRYSSPGSPELHLFTDDFDQNNQSDPLFAVQSAGEFKPLHSLRSMSRQLPRPMQRVQSFETYSRVSLDQLIGQNPLDAGIHHTANYFSSSLFLNRGGNQFDVASLPNEAQVSAVKDILTMDLNRDGSNDLILAGNEYNTNPEVPRLDAGNGLVLLGDGAGRFDPLSTFMSGFITQKDARSIAVVRTALGDYILVGNNNSGLQIFKITSD